MSVFEIPLIPSSNQRLSVSLVGVTYQMTVKWCPPANSWIIDIADINGVPIVSGIPMITGADLLAQYAYLDIGVGLVVQTDFDPTVVPTFDDLGLTGHLYVTAP